MMMFPWNGLKQELLEAVFQLTNLHMSWMSATVGSYTIRKRMNGFTLFESVVFTYVNTILFLRECIAYITLDKKYNISTASRYVCLMTNRNESRENNNYPYNAQRKQNSVTTSFKRRYIDKTLDD